MQLIICWSNDCARVTALMTKCLYTYTDLSCQLFLLSQKALNPQVSSLCSVRRSPRHKSSTEKPKHNVPCKSPFLMLHEQGAGTSKGSSQSLPYLQ